MKPLFLLTAVLAFSGCIMQGGMPSGDGNYTAEGYDAGHSYMNVSSGMLFPNLRWLLPIRYYLNLSEAGVFDEGNFQEAVEYWENWTDGTVRFERVYSPEEAGLYVKWKRTTDSTEPGTVNLGLAGPNAVTDTGLYNLSSHAEMLLAPNYLSTCPRYLAICHEMGHVLGLGHSEDEDSLMYPMQHCWQKLTDADKMKLKEIYSAEPLPDLYFKNFSVSRSGDTLNVYFELHNRGIIESPNTTVKLVDGGKVLWESKVSPIDPRRYGWWKVTVTGRFSEQLTLKIDPDNTFREYDKTNNVLVLGA